MNGVTTPRALPLRPFLGEKLAIYLLKLRVDVQLIVPTSRAHRTSILSMTSTALSLTNITQCRDPGHQSIVQLMSNTFQISSHTAFLLFLCSHYATFYIEYQHHIETSFSVFPPKRFCQSPSATVLQQLTITPDAGHGGQYSSSEPAAGRMWQNFRTLNDRNLSSELMRNKHLTSNCLLCKSCACCSTSLNSDSKLTPGTKARVWSWRVEMYIFRATQRWERRTSFEIQNTQKLVRRQTSVYTGYLL